MGWNDEPAAQPQNAQPNKPAMSPEQLVADWESKQLTLAAAKEAEKAARDAVAKAYFANPRVGTNKHDLTGGYVLKMQHGVTRKFVVPTNFPKSHPDKEPTVTDAVEHLAERLRRSSNEGAFIADRLIKYEYSLSESEYKKLPDDLRKIVDEYIESKPKTPIMELVEPKK